jgi:hypothetical protein
MRRNLEPDLSLDDLLFSVPPEIWLSIALLITPFPLRILITLSSLNSWFYKTLLLVKSREALLSLGVGKIKQMEGAFFLDGGGMSLPVERIAMANWGLEIRKTKTHRLNWPR